MSIILVLFPKVKFLFSKFHIQRNRVSAVLKKSTKTQKNPARVHAQKAYRILIVLFFFTNGIYRAALDAGFYGFSVFFRRIRLADRLAVIVYFKHVRLRRSAQAAANTGILIHKCTHNTTSFFYFFHTSQKEGVLYLPLMLFASPEKWILIWASFHRAARPRDKS